MTQQATEDASLARLRVLADRLDCFLEQDVCELFAITPSTALSWRKRGRGPRYSLVGNAVLYPRAAVKAEIDARVRERATASGKDAL